MRLYCGIDLHSNNNVIAVIDETGAIQFKRRLRNDLSVVKTVLAPYRERLSGVVVESTFNWYWLVDGLKEAGYRMHLANPAACKQYDGLKHGDDDSDALWLAEMLRLGILREGYIYPKSERGVRDLLRKRSQLVEQRTGNLLSLQNVIARNTGKQLRGDAITELDGEQLAKIVVDEDVALSIAAGLRVHGCLKEEVDALERAVLRRVKMRPEFIKLNTIPGVGDILGLTIMLETGEISRFADVGNYASYCRCVDSKRMSNGKKKGKGNVRNGNRYLSWAFTEAAHFAVRYSDQIRKFHHRKQRHSHSVVAIRAVAHKLARASYFIMRDQVDFDVTKAFG
jgi:transposase